jgi:uncharacterized protein
MQTATALFCGLIFGWGLLISGMLQPSKVIGFLDIFGAWDPSLAVVMAAALATAGAGYKLIACRELPQLSRPLTWTKLIPYTAYIQNNVSTNRFALCNLVFLVNW